MRVLLSVLVSAALAACASNGTVRDTPTNHPASTANPAAAEAAPSGDAQTDSLESAPNVEVLQSPGQPQSAASLQKPTQAELDYAALYGDASYDPVADSTLPAAAELPTSYDPWEKLNRKVHAFNNVVDHAIATPLARAYVAVVPRPVRLGVGNFFSNLGQPITAMNSLLQGKPANAVQALGRFSINFTVGIVGIFDPATRLDLPNRNEDFGQTLGVWGWKRSRYLELPLFGPRTVRDVFGLVGDAPLSPVRQINDDPTRIFLQGLQLVDVRTQLFAVDSLRAGATDDYALVRDSWLQRRRYQILGDRTRADDASLPEYLREDGDNPSVPADAMPIIPGSSP